jgi:signal transduction histidine kinase
MLKPDVKERFFRWMAVPALAAVLVLLAILQYHWSAQVSTATRTQMQTALQNSLLGFRQDVARELASPCLEIKSALDAAPGVDAIQIKEQFSHWQQTSAHPNLVQHIYLWDDPTHQQPYRLDPGRDQFERVNWPAEFSFIQQHLEMVSAMLTQHTPQNADDAAVAEHHRRHFEAGHGFAHPGHMRRRGMSRNGLLDFLPPGAVDQSIPALIYLVRRHPADAQSNGPAFTWLVVQLNKNVLEKEIFPELAQKYFRGTSGLDYHVAVRESGSNPPHVVYASDPGFGADESIQVDASMNLFGPPFGRSGPPGPEFFAVPGRPVENARPAGGDDRRGSDRNPRFEVMHHPGDQGIWQVLAKHKSGSVEAAVSGLRRRNLMASFGVLVVLGVTMGLILIASQRARRLAKLQMDFVTGVSHELRTPLAVIFSAGENIAHGVVEDKQQLVRYGNTIVRQTRQLTNLVEQVLQFAATQQPPRKHGLSPVDLPEAIEAALEGAAATVASAKFTVERQLDPDLPPVTADFNGLVQSLQNLITNAVKYGGENRWLRVSARTIKENNTPAEIAITVEDRGIGISREEIKQIFEPFYRSPAVTESGIHGTGLGLPLTRKIVEAMGGRVTAQSELGKGSTFTIHLPVAEVPGMEEPQRTADRPAGAEPGFSS